MGWGNWMVPTLTDAEDLQLRGNELALIQSAESAPDAVAALAASLLRQNAMQKRIIQQATGHILELEAREVAQVVADRMKAKRRRDEWLHHLLARGRADWEIVSRIWRQSA